ncbi:MAG TPA: amidohydrolase family protein [Bryobacteraceae bacterium]
MELKIGAIDSHVHIWTDDFAHYPLDVEFAPADLAIPRFMPDDVFSHALANGVDRVVLVQMSYYGSDNSLMLDAIRLSPERFRGIAVIDENRADLLATMGRLRKCGIRAFRVMAIDPALRLLDRPGLRNMLDQAARHEMAIDFLTAPEILPELDRLCEQFPDTSIVVDHMARIGMNGPIVDKDVKALCSLAHHRNTAVKISAFYALGEKRPPHDDLAPMIRQLYGAFGPSRLMWGSDAPFQTMYGSYGDSIDFIRKRLPFLTEQDQDWILRGTAERLFFQD